VQAPHLKFREELIRQLVGDFRAAVTRKRPRSSDGDINRMDGLFHKLGKGKHRDCAVCSNRNKPGGRKQSPIYCETCTSQPALCPGECFNTYHTVTKYRNDQ